MKILTYLLLYFSLSLICYSCNNKEGKKQASVNTTETTIDSLNPVRSEKMINPYAPLDISPMDMSYYPIDYPILRMTNTQSSPPLARVIYSRPHLQGRSLFHDLLKYGEPWRLGANEASEMQLYQDATIQGKKIKAGRYVLYCIPQDDKWTVIFNSNIDSWGLKPDVAKDVARFDIPIRMTNRHLEYFTMVFEKTDGAVQLLMAWDNIEARLPMIF